LEDEMGGSRAHALGIKAEPPTPFEGDCWTQVRNEVVLRASPKGRFLLKGPAFSVLLIASQRCNAFRYVDKENPS
jgi:hypothetical protein